MSTITEQQDCDQQVDYTPYYVEQLHELALSQKAIIDSLNMTVNQLTKDQRQTNELLRRGVKSFFLFLCLSITSGVAAAIPWHRIACGKNHVGWTIVSIVGLFIVFCILCCLFDLMKFSKSSNKRM